MFLLADHEDLWGPAPAYGAPAICLSDRVCVQALVDEEDHAWARKWLWSYTYSSGSRVAAKVWLHGGRVKEKLYARRTVSIAGSNRNIFLHREIAIRAYGPAPSPAHVSDHINGDSLDCRRENLRWATLSQNARNLYGSAWLQLRMDL